MTHPLPPPSQTNYQTFRDCLSEPILRALAAPAHEESSSSRKKKRKEKRKEKKKGKKAGDGEEEGGVDSGVGEMMVGIQEEEGVVVEFGGGGGKEGDCTSSSGGDDLGDFIEYLTSQIFPSLPTPLKTLSHTLFTNNPKLQTIYTPPLTPALVTSLISQHIPALVIDSLESYALLPAGSDASEHAAFFAPILNAYVSSVTAPPAVGSATRTSECELCGRSWIPLTYHHLIPRSTHERVLKRRWHGEGVLNSVAWLCRACHSFVHRLASNEELAKGFYTVELIREGGAEGEKRTEVEGWVKWVAGVRWKSR